MESVEKVDKYVVTLGLMTVIPPRQGETVDTYITRAVREVKRMKKMKMERGRV